MSSLHAAFSRIVAALYSIYSLNTLVLLLALLFAVLPARPAFMNALDNTLYELVATPSQLNLLKNERSIAISETYQDLGVNGVASSLASIFNGDAFRLNNTRDLLIPAAFHPAERIAFILVALLMIRGLSKVHEARSAKWVALGAIGTLSTELALLYFSNVWVPLGLLVQFSIGAYLIMLLQVKYERRAFETKRELQRIAFEYVRRLHPDSESNQILQTLHQCGATESTLEFAYNFAEERYRAHQHSVALAAYQFVSAHNKRYQSVADRIKEINTLFDEQAALVSHGNSALDATMVVDTSARSAKLGRYEILRELGRGAMGVVYLGKDPSIARHVAIKTLSYKQFSEQQLPEVRERFFREAKAAGRLSHPNIVTVYDMGEAPDLAFIAMDYIEGTSLDRHCREDNLLPIETVYVLMLQVAEALSYAHQNKIVHRDIKPSNLMYNATTQQVKVSDFGIARMSDESRTKTGQVMGSPVYMAPEQLKGAAVTGAADIFSLGATFYQLLTGSTPFNADSLPELTIKIMSKKHKSVRELRSELPASAVRITNKALNKEPGKRFESAEEMASQLRKALANDFNARVA